MLYEGRLDEARELFSVMPESNVGSWDTVGVGLFIDAVKIYQLGFQKLQIDPDHIMPRAVVVYLNGI